MFAHHRYEVLRTLGEGVFHARDLLADGPIEVVLKEIPTRSERSQESIIREFFALSALSHPSIVSVLDLCCSEQGRHYLTTEFIPGEALDRVGVDATEEQMVELLICAAEGLGAAHDCGILHQDLKPANLIARLDPHPELVIVDFGLARNMTSDQDRIGGTPGFIAPEILRGQKPSIRSDLFGLGKAFEVSLSDRVGNDSLLRSTIQSLTAKDPLDRPTDVTALFQTLGVRPKKKAFLRPPFVGRRQELRMLTGPSPAVMRLCGPSGAGKSRLLREARHRLSVQGRFCFEIPFIPGDLRPFGPVPKLISTLSGLSADQNPVIRSQPKDFIALSEGLFAALINGASQKPILFFDDLDHASPSATELIIHLARGCLQERPATMILSTSSAELDAELGEALPGSGAIELGGLEPEDISGLVEAFFDRRDSTLARKIWERSNGLTTLTVEILGKLRDQGRERSEIDLETLTLSSKTTQSIENSLKNIPGTQLELLATIAAFGKPIAFEELRSLFGDIDRAEILGLDQLGFLCLRNGLLSIRSAAVVQALPKVMPSKQIHEKLAKKLADSGAAQAHVDRHLAAAGHPDAAIRTAQATADQGAPRRGLAILEPLIARLREHNQATAHQLLELASLRTQAGEYQKALEIAEPLAESTKDSIRKASLVLLGEILERSGELSEARKRLEAALSELDPGKMRDQALVRLSRVYNLSGHAQSAESLAQHSLSEPDLIGSPDLKAALRTQLAMALITLDRREEGIKALELAHREAKDNPKVSAATLGHLAICRMQDGELAEARQLYEEALETAENSGDITSIPAHLLNLAIACQLQPDPSSALDLFRRAEAMSRRMGRKGPLAGALVNKANLYTELGAIDEALRAANEALELATVSGLPIIEGQAALVLAEIALVSGDQEAGRFTTRARHRFESVGDMERAAETLLVEGELAFRSGDRQKARNCRDQARDLGTIRSSPRYLLLDGKLLHAQGQTSDAVTQFERALDLAERSNQPDMAARAEITLAGLYENVGSPLADRLRETASERLTTIALRLPPAYRETFWTLEHRAQARKPLQIKTRSGEEAAFRLLDLSPRILSERDADRVLEKALDAGIDVTGAERGFLLLQRNGKWRVAAARNIDKEALKKPSRKFSVSIAEEVADTGEPLLTANAQGDPRLLSARSVHQLALESVVCVPILSQSRVLGTIYLENRFSRGQFDKDDLRLALALANQVALALEAGRLERELRQQTAELSAAKAELATRVEQQEDELARLERVVRQSRVEKTATDEYSGIVGGSAVMRDLFDTLARVTDTSLPVLIEGETGTGKELVARAIHQEGPRKDKPFVSINCGALPDLLLEGELFGHERGAFTGADRKRIGLLREASGGTLLLDEIGEMSPAMQVKLLRAIQNAEVTPLGSEQPVHIDIRWISATHRSLQDMVDEGTFRQDLFYRLKVIHINVPPLRDRLEDVPRLVRHLLKRIHPLVGSGEKKNKALSLTRDALSLLLTHSFPGNIRELENLLSTAVALCNGDHIEASDIPLSARSTHGGSRSLGHIEKSALRETLKACGFNISKTARQLGLSRPTVYKWLREYQIDWKLKA